MRNNKVIIIRVIGAIIILSELLFGMYLINNTEASEIGRSLTYMLVAMAIASLYMESIKIRVKSNGLYIKKKTF